MRTGNIVVVGLGLAATVVAVIATVVWWRLPSFAEAHEPAPAERKAAALDALRTVAAVATAGAVAGLLVAGVAGRLVMRTLAATSGASAQGRLTEAGEVVGRISGDGTVGFIIFIGLFAGLFAGSVFVLLRRWLPATAGPAGLVLGIVMLGTFGVTDPLSPDNVDFRVLEPAWLAVALVAGTGLLTGTTFTTLAARLSQVSLAAGRRRLLAYPGLVFVALPSPLLVVAALYIGARSMWPNGSSQWLARPLVRRAGVVGTALLVVGAAATTVVASVSILNP